MYFFNANREGFPCLVSAQLQLGVSYKWLQISTGFSPAPNCNNNNYNKNIAVLTSKVENKKTLSESTLLVKTSKCLRVKCDSVKNY